MVTFLTFRFIAEAFIVSPNNLSALRALPEHQVMMASGLIGLARSIANTLGPAVSAVFWDQRYGRHLQILGKTVRPIAPRVEADTSTPAPSRI